MEWSVRPFKDSLSFSSQCWLWYWFFKFSFLWVQWTACKRSRFNQHLGFGVFFWVGFNFPHGFLMNQTVRETKILEETNITNAFLKKHHGTYLFSTFSFVPMTMKKTLQKGWGEQKYHVNLYHASWFRQFSVTYWKVTSNDISAVHLGTFSKSIEEASSLHIWPNKRAPLAESEWDFWLGRHLECFPGLPVFYLSK